MAVDPEDVRDISTATVIMYRDAELYLLRLIASYLAKGVDAPTWAEERLAAVQALRVAAEDVLGGLQENLAAGAAQQVAEAYRLGVGAALTDLPADLATRLAARAASLTGVTRTAAIESLASALLTDVGQRHSNVLRHVIDVYRAVIARASAVAAATGITRRQASQYAYSQFVRQGVVSFTDAAGRTWRLSSYVEMALRTVNQRAAVQGQTDRLEHLGLDLVIISDSPGECPLCRPWEGKVLAIAGETGRVQHRSVTTGRLVNVDVDGTLTEARAAGLFHPNCTHAARAYLPGATVRPKGDLSDPEHNKAKERQREIERRIRGWKEREATALTPEAKRAATAKVRAWQGEMREHLDDNPKLKRLRYREQIGAGNIPPKPDGVAPALPDAPDPTGPTGAPAPSPAVIRPELAGAGDTIGVEVALGREIRRITGRTVPVNFGPGAQVDTAREHAEGILRMLVRYPQLDLGSVDWFDSGSGGAPGIRWAEADGREVRFNLAWSQDRDAYVDSLARSSTWTDDRPGYHPRNSGNGVGVAVHEMTHLLHGQDEETTAEIRALVRTMAGDGSAKDLVSRQVGRYAATRGDIDELAADAMVDVMVNGDQASDLSRGVVAILDRAAAAGRRGTGDHDHAHADAPQAELTPEAARYHRSLDGIEDLAESVEHGQIVSERPLTGGGAADTYLVRFADGRRMVRKRSRSTNQTRAVLQADAEQLASELGRALDVQIPRVYRRDPTEVWMEYIDAISVQDLLQLANGLDEEDAILGRAAIAVDSDEGRRLGLLDLMLINGDRHPGNWLLTDDDEPVPVDHGFAFSPLRLQQPPSPPEMIDDPITGSINGPFAAHFSESVEPRSAAWAPNDLTIEDVALVRERLHRLRGDFALVGREDWLTFALRVLDTIEPYATGQRNLIAGR